MTDIAKKQSATDTYRVLLVDDHRIVRGGTRMMLAGSEFEVIAEAASGKEAVQVVQTVTPDITLLDIRMAGGDGFDALVQLKN